MKAIRTFTKSHPLLSFYALAFAITWGGLIAVVGGPGEILGSPEALETRLPLVLLAWLAGPSVASILMTGLVHGRAGLLDLFAKMTRWRVGAGWYAVALLTAPLSSVAVLLALSLSSPEYLPTILTTSDRASLLLQGIVGTLVGGIFEELGWTGFAAPTLLGRTRYGVLSTGLIVGVLWGAWHILGNDIWASVATSGGLPPALFAVLVGLILLVGQLLALRVLMVWVYERTGSNTGSVMPAPPEQGISAIGDAASPRGPLAKNVCVRRSSLTRPSSHRVGSDSARQLALAAV